MATDKPTVSAALAVSLGKSKANQELFLSPDHVWTAASMPINSGSVESDEAFTELKKWSSSLVSCADGVSLKSCQFPSVFQEDIEGELELDRANTGALEQWAAFAEGITGIVFVKDGKLCKIKTSELDGKVCRFMGSTLDALKSGKLVLINRDGGVSLASASGSINSLISCIDKGMQVFRMSFVLHKREKIFQHFMPKAISMWTLACLDTSLQMDDSVMESHGRQFEFRPLDSGEVVEVIDAWQKILVDQHCV